MNQTPEPLTAQKSRGGIEGCNSRLSADNRCLITKTQITVAVFVTVLIGALVYPSTAAKSQPNDTNRKGNTTQVLHADLPISPTTTPERVLPKNAQPQRPTSAGTYSGRNYTKEEVKQLIIDYSTQYGINPSLPLRIAQCESGYHQFAKSRISTASGVFQYIRGTWNNTPEGKQGLSVFDADANVRAAVRHIATHGTGPWEADPKSKTCWS